MATSVESLPCLPLFADEGEHGGEGGGDEIVVGGAVRRSWALWLFLQRNGDPFAKSSRSLLLEQHQQQLDPMTNSSAIEPYLVNGRISAVGLFLLLGEKKSRDENGEVLLE